jgi:uncharacterized membrane protein YdfJ with MMPL/SSD domain
MNNKSRYLHNLWWDVWLRCWYDISQFRAETYENKGLTQETKTTQTALRDSGLLSSKLGAYRNYVLWITIFIYLLLVTTRFIFEGATVWMIALLSRSTNYVTVLPRALPKFSSVFTLHRFQVPKHQPVYDLGMSWTHHSTKVSRGFQSLATGAP